MWWKETPYIMRNLSIEMAWEMRNGMVVMDDLMMQIDKYNNTHLIKGGIVLIAMGDIAYKN